jgi:hypothetical protein
VVLAISDESADVVAPYVDELGLTIKVAAGSTSFGAYGVPHRPRTYLVDASGKLAWKGQPDALSNSAVEAALKGAKPRSSNFLAFAPSAEAEGRVAAQLKSIEQGKLGKAHAALTALAADDKATDAEKTGAAALVAEIDGHVGALVQQAERFTKARDVQKSVLIYDGLAKEFGAAKHGADAKAKADEIRKDATLSKELAAAEAFEKTRASVAKLGTTKAREKWKEFAEKYKGTRAGERAMAVARPAKN